MIRKKYFKVYFTILVLGFVLCIIIYHYKDSASMESIMSHIQGDAIIYSKESGVYSESISISLERSKGVPKTAEIYYTMDGSDPTTSTKRYTDDIELKITDELVRYKLKTVLYYKNDYSEVFEKEYVLCKDTGDKYGLDRIYITTSLDNLYDNETGIFADENYYFRGDEWIRDAHLIMFGAGGEVLINDEIGIGVSGGTSSAMQTKSLKIYADEKYGSKEDKFYINLREDDSSYFTNVTEYNSLRLRSGSQDMDTGNIRSAVVSTLALNSNFDGCTESRRCIVYLNGKFYGIFDIQQNYSNSFLAKHFNLKNSEEIEKIKCSENISFEKKHLKELFDVDLNDEENREKLENQVDMDNYLLYYAIEILCGNTDWPNNGFEMWRYTGEMDPNNIYSDGRWRFLLYDVDLSFPVEATAEFFEGSKAEQFDTIMNGIYRSEGTSFINTMQSEYYRDKFITILCDLLNTSFSGENMLKIINDENNKIAAARKEFYDENYDSQSELNVEQMRQYALKRSAVIGECITRYFGCSEKYMMNLEISDGVEVYWNNEKFYAGETYLCEYYRGVQLTINQDTYPGYEFKYWLVNDQPIYEDKLLLTDDMINNGLVCIKPVLEKEKEVQIVISEIHSKGKDDWIKITNVGSVEVNIGQYYLTDDSDNLQQYQLPQVILRGGESIVIHGSKNRDAIGDYICNFSLSEYETITLSNGEEICDYVCVPRMAIQETYGRYDNSNQWMFFAYE